MKIKKTFSKIDRYLLLAKVIKAVGNCENYFASSLFVRDIRENHISKKTSRTSRTSKIASFVYSEDKGGFQQKQVVKTRGKFCRKSRTRHCEDEED